MTDYPAATSPEPSGSDDAHTLQIARLDAAEARLFASLAPAAPTAPTAETDSTAPEAPRRRWLRRN